MAHIDLRDFDDDDHDAVFAMMRDREALELVAFTADHPDDPDEFDAWLHRRRAHPDVTLFTVTEDGGYAGTAALFRTEADREVTIWLARHAWGRGIGTATLEILVSREPERPLYARAAAHNAAAVAILRRVGFAEVSRAVSFAPGLGRDAEQVVFALVPNLDGI